jgi:hypothetical protein
MTAEVALEISPSRCGLFLLVFPGETVELGVRHSVELVVDAGFLHFLAQNVAVHS